MLLSYLPILIMMGFVSALAIAVLFVSSLLRPSNPYPEKLKPWECGFEPIGEVSKEIGRAHV
jgi:NADH-quinone oxidoreductase subunit A